MKTVLLILGIFIISCAHTPAPTPCFLEEGVYRIVYTLEKVESTTLGGACKTEGLETFSQEFVSKEKDISCGYSVISLPDESYITVYVSRKQIVGQTLTVQGQCKYLYNLKFTKIKFSK